MKGNIPDKTAWDELITYHITESKYEEHMMVVSIDHLTSAHTLLCQLCGFLYTNPIIHALSSCSILLSECDHLWKFMCKYCSLHL